MSGGWQEHHRMLLLSMHESGDEEWYCPTCGRRFLLQYYREIKKIIYEVGDAEAIHSGGYGSFAVEPQVEELFGGEVSIDDPRLAPWVEWMEKVNFESLWGRGY